MCCLPVRTLALVCGHTTPFCSSADPYTEISLRPNQRQGRFFFLIYIRPYPSSILFFFSFLLLFTLFIFHKDPSSSPLFPTRWTYLCTLPPASPLLRAHTTAITRRSFTFHSLSSSPLAPLYHHYIHNHAGSILCSFGQIHIHCCQQADSQQVSLALNGIKDRSNTDPL